MSLKNRLKKLEQNKPNNKVVIEVFYVAKDGNKELDKVIHVEPDKTIRNVYEREQSTPNGDT